MSKTAINIYDEPWCNIAPIEAQVAFEYFWLFSRNSTRVSIMTVHLPGLSPTKSKSPLRKAVREFHKLLRVDHGVDISLMLFQMPKQHRLDRGNFKIVLFADSRTIPSGNSIGGLLERFVKIQIPKEPIIASMDEAPHSYLNGAMIVRNSSTFRPLYDWFYTSLKGATLNYLKYNIQTSKVKYKFVHK